MAPSYSRGRDETSRKEPDAPLGPVQPDFVTRASKETNKFEPTFGLHSKMDEFRRLKVMYLTAPTRELAEFHMFAKAMAAHREDGRGSEDRGGDNRGDTGDDQRRGRHNSRKDLKDSASAASMTDLLREPGGTRRAIAPTRAQIPLVATTDVAATGVGRK